MTTIYTSKKTGATYINLVALENGKFQLTSTEDPTDIITTTESVLKRWYKKTVEVDFTNTEDKPAEEEAIAEEETTEEAAQEEPETTKKSSVKKSRKPRAKTYEEQKWGLSHTRMSLDTFCDMFGISDLEFDYNSDSQIVSINAGASLFHRRAWKNEMTGSVWFRFKNHEYELTDVSYVG